MTRPRKHRRARQEGFTLIELLVALTLLALLATTLFGGLRFGARAWERTRTQGDAVDETRLVREFLRREIAQAYPMPRRNQGKRPTIQFRGNGAGMDFLAPTPEALGGAGLIRLRLAAEVLDGAPRLALSWRPELAFDGEAAWRPVGAALLDKLGAVEFGYFGADKPGHPAGWHARWEDRDRLPDLVRLRVAFPAGDARRWPDLVIAPHVAVDADCVYAQLTKKCQGR